LAPNHLTLISELVNGLNHRPVLSAVAFTIVPALGVAVEVAFQTKMPSPPSRSE
jgi:hypothetical protein